MAIIFTYPVIKAADLASTDRLIISKMNSVGNNPTKSLTLANLANFIGPLIPGLGTVTGTGTTDTLPIWADGPNGVLGDSPISYDSASEKVSLPLGLNAYVFAPGSFNSSEFDFKSATFNGGFYRAGGFRFEQKLAVGRTNDPTGATLDVGTSTDTSPAAWFRNGVVISNNPSGVNVDNTSVVIGAGNNDIVSGSDNC